MVHFQRAPIYLEMQRSCISLSSPFGDDSLQCMPISKANVNPDTQQCQSFISVLNFKNKHVLLCECDKMINLA